MKQILILPIVLVISLTAYSQSENTNIQDSVIELERDSLRLFFGTYEFAPQFIMKIFSLNEKVFAQRIGDEDKFQIFPKLKNVFFLKSMPAELEFTKSAKGVYDTLVLYQSGKEMM